ncbi:MAG: sphingosine kinase, partial [Spirochaetales bacterium]|nr:sphingosine kinase [Spirochaetales bacterium]
MKEKLKTAFQSCTFIINPTRFPEYAKILKKVLKRTDAPLIIESKNKEHFIESVRDFCSSDFKHLLVWGGDGTAHDAINALTEELGENQALRRKKSIGFLRGGSGNGIQDSYEVPFGIRKQVETYADSMNNNYVVDVDLLETSHGSEKSYCQLVGIGFDATVLRKRQSRQYHIGKRKGFVRTGMFNYLVSGLSTFICDYSTLGGDLNLQLYHGKYAFKGTRVNAEMPFDYLERQVNPMELEAGSRPYYGRLFKICPDVVCNDGYLDLYVYNFENQRSALANLFWLWIGRHDKINKKLAKGDKPLIERYEVSEVDISAAAPFDYHIDGELVSTRFEQDGAFTVHLR